MRPFTYTRAATEQDALSAMARAPESAYLGGGTNLLDLMKMGVARPVQLVDITRVPLDRIEEHEGGIRIGSMVRNSDAAAHALIRQRYPILSQAILAGASPQLRNMATMGGNLMQRTRCYYFYDPSYQECNKRKPGSGCAARQGINRIHAILGASEKCIATHPSDMCVALAALQAVVQVRGPKGERSIPFSDFHRLPGDTPHIDTNLAAGELITYLDLPPNDFARASHYLKVRDRNSYAFALVSVAALLNIDQAGKIRDVRIALGGVAHKPWRVVDAERAIVGQPAGDEAYRHAAEILVKGAKPYQGNAFKVELARRSIVRALQSAAATRG